MKNPAYKDALFIIDGSSFLYRAYYAIRPLHTKTGMPIHAVYGFCRMIKKLIDNFEPSSMVLVFDSGGKTERHTIYEGYKLKRQAPPSDLVEQRKLITEFAQIIKLPLLEKLGVEADDLMYSIAQKAIQENIKVVIVSSDKDMGQLVSDQIHLFDPFKDEFYDRTKLEERYGLPVEKLPFYFALLGDSSDNIPGVRGIGEKTAKELVNKFNSLEDLYAHLSNLESSATAKKLIDSRDNAFLSYQLFLLRDHPIDIDPKTISFSKHNWFYARPFFEKLEFNSLLKDMPAFAKTSADKPTIAPAAYDKYRFMTVTETDQLTQVCEEIRKKKAFAIDTEGHGLRPLQDGIVGLCIAIEPGTAYYIPCGHTTGKQLDKKEVIAAFKPLLEDPAIKKYMHHAKFDSLMLYHEGVIVRGIEFDTLIAASLALIYNEKLGLKYLSEHYLQESMLTYEAVVKDNKYKNFAEVPLDLATQYAAADAHQTLLLTPILKKELERLELTKLFYEIEFPLMPLLVAMEINGIYCDTQVLQELNVQISKDLETLRTLIIEQLGPNFETINLNSPKQLAQLLFDHLQLPKLKMTEKKTGYSTDHAVLQELAFHHEVPALILKYRELYKLRSTYIEALPKYINPMTNKIHTNFNQTSVATGRLSSSDPNLQNIPVSVAGYRVHVRAAFKPDPETLFISADYSQIELRVLAYLSQDEALKNAFLSGYDIHAQTAANIFDVAIPAVTQEQRQIGKRINFSIIYGLTPYGLSKDLGISYKQAERYIEKYFAQYPKIEVWINQVIEDTKKNGYVTTLWGRRRAVPGIYERNRTAYDAAVRIAVNTRVQGTAAEIMKLGMIQLSKALAEQNLQAKILLQIHDELLLQVPEAEILQTTELTQKVLQSVIQWDIPLVVTTRVGTDWQAVTK